MDGDDEEVRKEDSISGGSSINDAGPTTLGFSNTNSDSEVSTRLGLSINLSLLQRQPSTPAASSISFRDTASSVGPFVEPVGPTQPLPSTATAIDFFKQAFDDDLFTHIVEQTNLYVRQKRAASYKWEDLTVPELKAFFGIIIYMGIVKKPATRDYWAQGLIEGELPIVTETFPRNRFLAILWNLHFNDNASAEPRGSPGYDKLHKIRPIISRLQQKFLSLYNPHRENSVDEAMVGFKGRSSLKQYVPKKPTKRGFKVWCRCDSKNGYTSDFQVYAGKQGDSTEKNLGARVVKDLAEDIQGKNYFLFFDNFFSSPTLLANLSDSKIYCVGTVAANRKEYPKFTKSEVTALERGQHIATQVLAEKVHCFVWKDRKPVYFVDTICKTDHTDVVSRRLPDGSSIDVACPLAVKLYNQNMGGVDLADQLRKSYTCTRKSRTRWYMRLFWFFLDLSITNAYILESVSPNHVPPIARTGRQKKRYRSQLEFRKQLVTQLIGDHSSRGSRGRPPIARRRVSDPTRPHFPEVLQGTANCVVCRKVHKIRKRTKFGCVLCGNIHMCPVPCFKIHHTQ